MKKVALVGAPNVGKSVIFNYLTSSYATVSNYPGTTVDISRGISAINGKKYQIIDTPGTYSLTPLTDEERVTRGLLCQEKPDLIIHVVDAKNIRRALVMTLQLVEAGFPVILNLNMIDESKKLGLSINVQKLADILGLSVNVSSAVKKIGLEALKQKISDYEPKQPLQMRYHADIERTVADISTKLNKDYGLSSRMAALLLMQGDELIYNDIRHRDDGGDILLSIKKLTSKYCYGLEYALTMERQAVVDNILKITTRSVPIQKNGLAEKLGRWSREPLTGIPILLFVLYLGIYQFVGQFGAGFLVEFIDKKFFEAIIIPVVQEVITHQIPYSWLQSLLIGDYGIISLGLRYAFVIILPIVGTFFLAFSLLEDCGYLPRLALLVDKVFKMLGLNGRAVIPVTLGLGCGTMAIMVTRTLESRRERFIASFLLSLAVPCSAQLGLVVAMLAHNPAALLLWSGYIITVFIIIGYLSARIMPGEPSTFYMELPPIRVPLLFNIFVKAYVRMCCYFLEIMPVFIITSVLLWVGDRSGLLAEFIVRAETVMLLLGLPKETAEIFLLGFFRRDYGAAGLYDMCLAGALTDHQLLVAAVTLTLFVPCIAQTVVLIKERGVVISIVMIILIIAIALTMGWVVDHLSAFLPAEYGL